MNATAISTLSKLRSPTTEYLFGVKMSLAGHAVSENSHTNSACALLQLLIHWQLIDVLIHQTPQRQRETVDKDNSAVSVLFAVSQICCTCCLDGQHDVCDVSVPFCTHGHFQSAKYALRILCNHQENIFLNVINLNLQWENSWTEQSAWRLVSSLVGASSPDNHRGLHQG